MKYYVTHSRKTQAVYANFILFFMDEDFPLYPFYSTLLTSLVQQMKCFDKGKYDIGKYTLGFSLRHSQTKDRRFEDVYDMTL